MIEAKRRDGETTSSFLRRFTKKIQQSRILLKARKTRFAQPKQTKRARQESAIRRSQLVKEREKLFKMGKLSENEYKRGS